MEKQKIEIRIAKDGTIQTETFGMKGRSCLKYIDILQELLQAEVIDSKFTPEYLMPEETESNEIVNMQQL